MESVKEYIKENIKLENIIENYEDITDIPPNYDDITSIQDEKIYDKFPQIKISISPYGLNSPDTFLDFIPKKKNLFGDLNTMDEFRIALQRLEKNDKNENKTNDIIEVKQKVSKQNAKSEKLEEKLKKGNEDLKNLNEKYQLMNTHLNDFSNQYEHLISNYNLNDSNKKIKIVNLMRNFMRIFNSKILEFKEIPIDFVYLEQLRKELYKTIFIRYELIFNYIVESRELKNYLVTELNLEN